jgi:hypothetical protein
LPSTKQVEAGAGLLWKNRILYRRDEPPAKVLLHILESVNAGANGSHEPAAVENFTASSLYCEMQSCDASPGTAPSDLTG